MTKVVRLEKFADELAELSKENIEIYKQTVIETLVDSIAWLVESSPVDTGLYAQSWKLDINEERALLGNIAPHAAIIEFGTRPYRPPIGPLLNWARRVLKKPELDSHCWALATYVQNKIEEEGMEPKHILRDAIERIAEDIQKRVKIKLGRS